MKLTFKLGMLGLVLGWCSLTRSAAAQQNEGFAIDRFDPAERGSDWFAADSLDIRGKGRLILGATGDWAYKPLVLYAPNGDEQTAVIRHQFFAHLGADLILADRLRLGVNLPIALYQAGDSVVLDGVTFESDNATKLGDLRLAADLRLLGEYRGPFELAIGVAGYLPTGSKSSYTGDGKARIAPRLLVAGEIGPFVYAARAGFLYRANDEGFAGASKSNEVFGAAAAGVRVVDGKLVIGPELYGSTSTASGDFFARRTSPFEILFGAHYLVSPDWRLGLGVGPGLTRGVGAPQVRGLLSIEWAPAVEQPSDRDGDGILDRDDACPNVAGEPSDDPRMHGCPPVLPQDRDRDGVLDADDACIDEPGVKTNDPKTNGCPLPAEAPKDRDQDGILDADDACIDEPGVKTNDPKTNGCPPPRDRDKDGIIDDLDACPDVPGPANADPKKNGCPAARVEQGQIKILGRVEFENNSAKIRPESEPILNAVLEVMNEHPEFTKLGVEGHTDNRGAAPYNKRLSQQRAQSVMKWLTGHGIAASRLSAAGFGMEKPLDNNDTEEGRQNNRRVEFHIQAVDGKPAVNVH